MINPLRYPGAKRSLVNYIEALLQANHLEGCTFLEPYAGSAAVGLELLQRNRIARLVLCEKDILIYAFWECVFRDTDILCNTIENVDVSIDTWHALQRYREMTTLEEAPLPELAYAGLFFNRTNFSGILKANPVGGIGQTSKYTIDCRFNKQKLIQITIGNEHLLLRQPLGLHRQSSQGHFPPFHTVHAPFSAHGVPSL